MVALNPTTPPDALSPEIEDQLLEAIITATLPTLSPDPSGPTPARAPTPTPPVSSPPPSAFPPPPSPSVSPALLARHFNISLRLLLDFLAQPSTRARIAAAVEAAQLAEYHRAQRARAKALDALERILDTTDDPIEKRRAASAILRPSRILPLISALSAQRLPAPHPDASPLRLRAGPERPSPHLTPQQAVVKALSRLDDNHNPHNNAGLTTLWNFFHRGYQTGIDRPSDLDRYLRSPGRDAELANYYTFLLHAPLPTPDPATQAALPATIIQHDGTPTSVLFRLTLIPDADNKLNQRWLISDIEHDFDPPDPGKSGHEIVHGSRPVHGPKPAPRIPPPADSS